MEKRVTHTEIIKFHSPTRARVTKIITPHGEVWTPAFMPVATRAFANHLTPQDLINTGSQVILGGNTYHMLCSPGLDVIEAIGGMHRFMGWNGPMLTDSGGFQVFSLSKREKLCKITEKGAYFKHPDTGQVIQLTPVSSIEAQKVIGADLMMAFDHCTPENGTHDETEQAMLRTQRWLQASYDTHMQDPNSRYGHRQLLFGIIQGGYFRDLREESAEFVTGMNLDGIAIGGEAIGFDMQKTVTILDWLQPFLPEHKIRYTMGVGLHPQDLINVVARGIDIFDCVAPTRNARHGSLYYGKVVKKGNWLEWQDYEARGRLIIKKSIYAKDERPIIEECECDTCKQFTRAYLHYLLKTNASLYYQLACIHNVYVMNEVCAKMRELILAD